ncbi:MAG: amidohydrolase family protein [Chloroflexi bacterium]|nr:amidohydrolase family protein [Chloroflexota bacterium]
MGMVIDVHVHLFGSIKFFPKVWWDELCAFKKAAMGLEAFTTWEAAFNQMGRPEALIADMDKAGVDKSVCLPLDYGVMCRQEPEVSIWKANEYVAEAQTKYPDRIIGWVGVDPLRGQEAIKLLEKAVKDWGLHGVKIYPSTFSMDDPSIQAFMSKVNEYELPVLLHMGSDPLPFIIKYGNPEVLDTLALWYPKMKMIAAHNARGHDDLLAAIMWYKQGVVYSDLSALQYELMKSPWHLTLQLRYLMDKLPNAILMGTDWPFVKTPPFPTHEEWFNYIRSLNIPEALVKTMGMGLRNFTQEEKDLILGENARKLLKL